MAVFAFDLLYLNGEALVRKPFKERRQLLQDHFHSVEGEFHFAKSADPETMEEVQELLEESVKGIINIIFFCTHNTIASIEEDEEDEGEDKNDVLVVV